jgi:hypothetical protein
MTKNQWDAIERQARIYVTSRLNGPDADAAVRGIIAWEWTNPDVSPMRRETAWSGIVARAGIAY